MAGVVVSFIIGIIAAIIKYMTADKSTPEAKKAALSGALLTGAAAGTLAYASGLGDKLADGFSDTSSEGGNPFTGEPVTVQTLADGTIRKYYPTGYYDVKPDGTASAFLSSLDEDGKTVYTPTNLLTKTGLLPGSTDGGKGGNTLGSGTDPVSPEPTSNWWKDLGLIGTGVVGGSLLGSMPSWVWLAGGGLLLFAVLK